jgi:hypothetical protein
MAGFPADPDKQKGKSYPDNRWMFFSSTPVFLVFR